MDFLQLAQYAIEQKASDIHLESGMAPVLRIDGEMRELRISPFSANDIMAILDSIMNETQKQQYRTELDLDFSVAPLSNCRFRVNAFFSINGPAAVFRAIPMSVRTLHDLNPPPAVEFLTKLEKGLVLVTGPTGSGKSTTLAAMVDYINENYSKTIITIEDPIEFVHKSRKSLISQREVGVSTHSFARALKSTLREDPDVILVGEMRDLETISLALTAAETGHLVFATLHTSSAAQTINRIIDIFPSEDKNVIRTMLSTSLEGIISQRLLKHSSGVGRVAAFEIMMMNHAIRNLIRENKVPQISSLIQIGIKEGMVLMRDYVDNLIASGIVKAEDAADILRNTDESAKEMIQQVISNNATQLNPASAGSKDQNNKSVTLASVLTSHNRQDDQF